jgi:hypothetical protein
MTRLYFLYMDGCPACEQAKPELAKFERSPAARGVEVVPVNLLKAKWTFKGWSPEATPTYVYEKIGFPRVRHEGGLTKERVVEFITKARGMVGDGR